MKEKPTPPREPAPEECCGKGCTPCVYDLYDAALERYKSQLEAWKLKRARAADAPAKAKPRRQI